MATGRVFHQHSKAKFRVPRAPTVQADLDQRPLARRICRDCAPQECSPTIREARAACRYRRPVAFRPRFVSNGRRIVFKEQLDLGTGKWCLVVTYVDGGFTPKEIEHLYADALSEWMHPRGVPLESAD